MTHEEFARAIGLDSKNSWQTIRFYEDGTTNPSIDRLHEMARVAGVELDEVVLFLDPALIKTIDEENAEARAIFESFMASKRREKLLSYLRAVGRRPPDKPIRPHRKGPGAGKRNRSGE